MREGIIGKLEIVLQPFVFGDVVSHDHAPFELTRRVVQGSHHHFERAGRVAGDLNLLVSFI